MEVSRPTEWTGVDDSRDTRAGTEVTLGTLVESTELHTERHFDAAVFDLDGVVTFTARIHQEAWKQTFDDFLRARSERTGEPFQEFTEDDYLLHVDGLPRDDGVRAFLSSRGITLPEDDGTNGADAETVVGLARRKNDCFQRLLNENGVDVDSRAVAFIRELRAWRICVGVASASRNTGLILRAAGLEGLFDARIDGEVSERLHLRGKPAPDGFLACLEILGEIPPARALVIEDAVAGVEAGREADFGLVLGVDRAGHAIDLRESGADWIIRDFSEVSAKSVENYFRNRHMQRPNAIRHWPEIAADLRGRSPAVFLDYDGTLTPIVDRPEHALLPENVRSVVARLAARWPTTIVSGRSRDDVTALVGLGDTVTIAGSHGFDISGPGASDLRLEVDPELPPLIADAAAEVTLETRGIPGVIVEDKRFAVAVHYRLVDPERVPEVEAAVDQTLKGRPGLRKAFGKKVFEIRPAIEWDKGRAILWLLEAMKLDRADVMPIYIGDDETDEDAFRALYDRGIGIVVTRLPRETSARYSLQNVEEVCEVLERLAVLVEDAKDMEEANEPSG